MDQTPVEVGRGDGGPSTVLHRLVAPPVVVGAQIGGELFHVVRQDHRVDMHIDHDEGLHHALKALLLCVVQGDSEGWHPVDFFGEGNGTLGHPESSFCLFRL